MLVIGNKKYRNLQEQVGWNTEQIEKIFDFLDGLEVEDNLIKLDNASGTLTAEEMEIVSRDVAFIIYNNNLYVKATTSTTEFIFKQVALNASDNGTYNILQSFRIVVTRASGAYAYAANTVLTLYNKSEADALLAAKADTSAVNPALASKANLSGADFTGAITSPSIIERMSGYSFTKASDTSKIHYNYKYAGIVKNGNKLTYVIYVQLTALDDITALSLSIELGQFTIPNSVGAKLYPSTQGTFTDVLATSTPTLQLASSNYSFKNATCVCRKFSNTQVVPYFYNRENIANGEVYNLRVEMTFLLSENLAS